MEIDFREEDHEQSRQEFDRLLEGRHINNLSLKDAMQMAKQMDVRGFKQTKNLGQVQMCLKLHLLKVNMMEKRGHEVIFDVHVHSKILSYPKLLFQRENALASF
jgi:hypothetical protein